MKLFPVCLLVSMVFLLSCNSDDEKRLAATQKEVERAESVYAKIDQAWRFESQPINATSQELTGMWSSWREFLSELSQKPTTSIGAFRKKAQTLSLRVDKLRTNIPVRYDKPEIRSRIAVLATKVHALDLFLSVNQIDADQVIVLIAEINTHVRALQNQFDEIVRKSQIPREEGEADMIRLLDTNRAIPTTTPKEIIKATDKKTLMNRSRPRKKIQSP